METIMKMYHRVSRAKSDMPSLTRIPNYRLRREIGLAVVAASFAYSVPVLAADLEPLKIGVPTALTGPFGPLGEQVQRGVEYAVEEANAKGGVSGRKIEVRFLDTQAKADLARQQAEKLALAGYNVLVGAVATGEALAISPMLERWDAIYMSTVNKGNDITGKACSKRMFRVNQPDYSDTAAMVPWLAAQKQKSWAIIGIDIAWGRDSGDNFTKAAMANGKTIVADGYASLGTKDFAPYIQKVASSGAEGLWVAVAGRDLVNFVTQAKQFGLLDKMLTAGPVIVSDDIVNTMGPSLKGVWGTINYSSTLDVPMNKSLVAGWARKYQNAAPTSYEAQSYSGMQVIFQAVQKAGSVKSKDIIRAMEGATFDTPLGRLLMRKEDHQLVSPNHMGYVGEVDGKSKPIIATTVPVAVATPMQGDSCKM